MSNLIQRLTTCVAHMAPHQKQREQGKLLIEALEEIKAANQVATVNADWFGNLVFDLSVMLGCEANAAAVIAAVEELKKPTGISPKSFSSLGNPGKLEISPDSKAEGWDANPTTYGENGATRQYLQSRRELEQR